MTKRKRANNDQQNIEMIINYYMTFSILASVSPINSYRTEGMTCQAIII